MLVPHVMGEGPDCESDINACRNIYDNLRKELHDSVWLVDGGYNQHEIKAIISHCNFFIGSRMHACIAALSHCIPSIGLAYSKKFGGVFESVGMLQLVIDLRQSEISAILDKIKKAYEQRFQDANKLKHTIPKVRSAVLELFEFSL